MRKNKYHQQQSERQSDEPAPLPPPEDVFVAEETPVEAPVSRRAPKKVRWRVVREALANVNGSFTRLAEGQVLDPLGYSETTLESIKAQGVVLEPVE